MKRMVLLFGVLVVACIAQAAPRPAAATATKPAVTNAPTSTTNAVLPSVELRDLEAKLYPIEAKLALTDPEIKDLMQQRKDLQQKLLQLDKKRNDLITAKLQANSATAAMVKRCAELRAKLQAMRAAGQSGGADAQINQPGFGPSRPQVPPQ